jgi:hypothetical protein
VEVEHAKMISDKVQASKAKGLEGDEDGGFPQPSARGRWKLQRAEADRIAKAREAGRVGDGGHPIARRVDA